MGRSRGGLTTKIHAVVDANGNPMASTSEPGVGTVLLAKRHSPDAGHLCATASHVTPPA